MNLEVEQSNKGRDGIAKLQTVFLNFKILGLRREEKKHVYILFKVNNISLKKKQPLFRESFLLLLNSTESNNVVYVFNSFLSSISIPFLCFRFLFLLLLSLVQKKIS